MNVAVLCNGLGVVNRGAETFALEFEKHLKNEFDIQLFGVKDTNTKTRNQIKLPWRNGRAYLESYYFGKYLYKNHILDNFDIILNNAGFPGSYWCNKQRKRTKTPFINRARGGGREEKISLHFKPDFTVFLTEFHRKKTSKRKNTVVIPNAVDIETSQEKSDLLKNFEPPFFLSASAIVDFKRTHLLIDAVEKYGKGTLIQASTGDLKDKIIEYGRSKLGNRFQYVGVLSKKELSKLYNSCDIFLLASKREAFGVIYLESMAHNLPVITEKDERRKEIIGSAGYLLDCTNTDLFADLIEKALNKDWKNIPMKQASKFSWNATKVKYIDLFEKVIK
jgi:glycosyltransferase involved in cell wall biosynthesis